MYFNSYFFILVFLPITVFCYFTINRYLGAKAGKIFLLMVNLIFYSLFNIYHIPLLLASAFLNYYLGRYLNTVRSTNRQIMLIAGLIINIGVLLFYKYYNFFITSINHYSGAAYATLNLIIPIGISFFTFQQLSYIIDSYKNPGYDYAILDYLLYATFYPYIISGPITLHHQIIPQFQQLKTKFDGNNCAKGLIMFCFGMAKKVLLADTLAQAANAAFNNVSVLNTTTAIFGMLAFTFQIYFDFSGYSNMAQGIALILNFELPLNFNSPYSSLSISGFWDSWHMTLTNFFTRYIYIPLGGNRKGIARTYINILLVFLISGFWHGAGWTFILWGFLNGLCSILYRLIKSRYDNLHVACQWLINFAQINLLWVFFRSNSITDAFTYIKVLITGRLGPLSTEFMQAFLLPEVKLLQKIIHVSLGIEPTTTLNVVVFWLFVTMLLVSLTVKDISRIMHDNQQKGTITIIISSIILVWSIISLSGVSSFIYVNF